MGDSVTAQCQEGTTDWFHKANTTRKLRPVPVGSGRNKGVSSNTTTMMMARFSNDVLSVGTDWLSMFGGLNDIGTVGSPNATTIQANLASMVNQFLATCSSADLTSGAKGVLLATIYPTTFMTTDNQKAARAAVNTWIAGYAAATPGVHLVDWATAMQSAADTIDPTKADDGVHPNATGATAMAGVLSPVITANVGVI